jgi:hypothetical protein
VSDWLKAELRLAERQGILCGSYLSVVQANAIYILNFLDEIERSRSKADLFRAALVASNSYKPEGLFPEYKYFFGDEPDIVEADDPIADSPDSTYDYSNVEWKSPQDAHDEYEQLMGKLKGLTTGTITGDQLGGFPLAGEWR